VAHQNDLIMTEIGNTFFFPWEVTLMEWLQANVSDAWISFMSFFSLFGEELPLILIVGFLYWSYDKQLGRKVGLIAIMGLTWNTMIKNIVIRRRPYFDHEGIDILRVVEPEADIYDISAQGYSFPSAHSTNAVTVFGSLAINLRKRWFTVIAIVIPLLTGISRFVVGAHYPTDVMAGWMLGLISVVLVQTLQMRVKSTLTLYGILLVTAVPGFFYCTSADYYTAVGLMIGFMGGTLLDDYCVHFEDTRKPLLMAVRLLGGLVVYLVVNTALKLPFSDEFLSNGSTAALMVRCARYAIVSFIGFGVYPMLFKWMK
jgi:membrane-associated phospholipid phosphatase